MGAFFGQETEKYKLIVLVLLTKYGGAGKGRKKGGVIFQILEMIADVRGFKGIK